MILFDGNRVFSRYRGKDLLGKVISLKCNVWFVLRLYFLKLSLVNGLRWIYCVFFSIVVIGVKIIFWFDGILVRSCLFFWGIILIMVNLFVKFKMFKFSYISLNFGDIFLVVVNIGASVGFVWFVGDIRYNIILLWVIFVVFWDICYDIILLWMIFVVFFFFVIDRVLYGFVFNFVYR